MIQDSEYPAEIQTESISDMSQERHHFKTPVGAISSLINSQPHVGYILLYEKLWSVILNVFTALSQKKINKDVKNIICL
jgi:hypothetical protein